MLFPDLKNFVANVMQMSHVYQPVMLLALIEKGGRATVRDIACSILSHDESQIEYYEEITKSMPGRFSQSGALLRNTARVAGLRVTNCLTSAR